MPSEKVCAILASKTKLTADEISALSEAEAWRIVYSTPDQRSTTPKRLVVCFTGFSQEEKDELTNLAFDANHHVTNAVTKKLGLLVCGENAGPKKLEKAAEQGVTLLTGAEYRELLTTRADA